MGLVRYRSGYATADVQRMSVQRDFVSAAIDQWASLKSIPKLPQALALVQSSLTTDLSTGNIVWLAGALLRASTENMVTETLSGQRLLVERRVVLRAGPRRRGRDGKHLLQPL